jgi:hypothetical protein
MYLISRNGKVITSSTIVSNHYSKIVLIVTVLINFFFLIYEMQLLGQFLQPWTGVVRILLFGIFFIATAPFLKYIFQIWRLLKRSRIIYLYILYLLYIVIAGTDDNMENSKLALLLFLIYNYMAVVSVLVFYVIGFDKCVKMMHNYLAQYIIILSIISIFIYILIGFGWVDFESHLISTKEYFQFNPPFEGLSYSFPYGVSLFRDNEVFTTVIFDFYRMFSLSTEPAKAAVFASAGLVFSYQKKPWFWIVLVYYLAIASFFSYIALVVIYAMLKIYKNKYVFKIASTTLTGVLLYFLYIWYTSDFVIFFNNIGFLNLHVMGTLTDAVKLFENQAPSIFGNGFSNYTTVMPSTILYRSGIVGAGIFLAFYILLLRKSMDNLSADRGKSYISLFSVFIILILILFIKSGFVNYYFFVYFSISYIAYSNYNSLLNGVHFEK